jgi:hypothetical protein
VSDRWSCREGYAQGQGRKFEFHRPRSTRLYAKKSATSQWAFPVLKSFFFLFLKTDFLFSGKRFLQTVGITEPPVEMHFHRRFLVTACRNVPFLRASSMAVLKNASRNEFSAACTVCVCTSGNVVISNGMQLASCCPLHMLICDSIHASRRR